MWRRWFVSGAACFLQVAACTSTRLPHRRSLSSSLLSLATKGHAPRFTLPTSYNLGRPWGAEPPLTTTRCRGKSTKSSIDLAVNPVTVTDIKQYLRSKNIQFYDGYSCLHVPSIFVDPASGVPAGSGTENLTIFIDKTTGRFLCKDTLVEGSWEDLQDCLEVMQKEGQASLSPHVLLRYTESLEEQEERETELREVQRIWSSSVPFSDVPEEEVQLVKTMFQINKISNATLKKFGVRLFKPTKSLVFPWIWGPDASLRGVKLVSAQCTESGKVAYAEATVPKAGSYHNLFGLPLVGRADTEVVLTGHEVDTLAVSQATGLPSVALPRGVSCLPPVLLPYLEQFKRVTLWLGEDLRSWEASKIFSRKLGWKRCSLVRPGEFQPCAAEALNNGKNLARIVKGSIPAAHKSIVSFRQLRDDVFGELENKEQVAGVKWMRFQELNKILKGHRKGELTVLTGRRYTGSAV